MATSVEYDDANAPSRIPERYWIERAQACPPEQAVHPKPRFVSYEMWTRRMVQTWTIQRLRAYKHRYRRCVDMGCGFGDWTALFAQLCDEVHAFDIAPAFVEATRRRVPMAHVQCASLSSYVLPRELDFVYIGAVLIYALEPEVVDVLRRVHDAMVAASSSCATGARSTSAAARRTSARSTGAFTAARGSWRGLPRPRTSGSSSCVRRRASMAKSWAAGLDSGRCGSLWRLASLPARRASHTLVFVRDR